MEDPELMIILELLGYDPDDIIDRNLTIERDGDELYTSGGSAPA